MELNVIIFQMKLKERKYYPPKPQKEKLSGHYIDFIICLPFVKHRFTYLCTSDDICAVD